MKITQNRFGAFQPGRAGMVFLLVLTSWSVAAQPTVPSPDTVTPIPVPAHPRDVMERQPYRREQTIVIQGGGGGKGTATLINLNPFVNAWYILRFQAGAGQPVRDYHLENVDPQGRRLELDGEFPSGLVLEDGGGKTRCALWGPGGASALDDARKSRVPYAELCDGKIYLRNTTRGNRTSLEAVSETIRSSVPAGESIVSFVKRRFFQDAYRQEGTVLSRFGASATYEGTAGAPAPALTAGASTTRVALPPELAIEIAEPVDKGLILGTWYAVKDDPGAHLSVMRPGDISAHLMATYPTYVSPLDKIETRSLVYLVAFDLDDFEVKYSLGTDNPSVGWSPRVLPKMRDPGLPGPDGIGSLDPLVATGLIPPEDRRRTAAAFVGGFKRQHGAFSFGELASVNAGSHYGFAENGVILSRLQPGLATLYVLDDGTVVLKTWEETDNALLPKVRYARQNGVPIVSDYGALAMTSVPGSLVNRWGPGNWSGSEDRNLRTMRSGVAIQEIVPGKRFLIFALFTTGTPSAMARVFQAYQCRYAMGLDMNALEHTYLALYDWKSGQIKVQHLLKGMTDVDRRAQGEYYPRFLAYPDNRDFFYLIRKAGGAS